MGRHEVVIDAEEAFYRIEGADFLYCVLIPLRVRLLLGSISPQIEEGEARVEEVGHFVWLGPLGARRWPLDTPRRRRGGSSLRARPKLPESSQEVLGGTASGLAAWLTLALLGCLEDSVRFLAAALASGELRGR